MEEVTAAEIDRWNANASLPASSYNLPATDSNPLEEDRCNWSRTKTHRHNWLACSRICNSPVTHCKLTSAASLSLSLPPSLSLVSLALFLSFIPVAASRSLSVSISLFLWLSHKHEHNTPPK